MGLYLVKSGVLALSDHYVRSRWSTIHVRLWLRQRRIYVGMNDGLNLLVLYRRTLRKNLDRNLGLIYHMMLNWYLMLMLMSRLRLKLTRLIPVCWLLLSLMNLLIMSWSSFIIGKCWVIVLWLWVCRNLGISFIQILIIFKNFVNLADTILHQCIIIFHGGLIIRAYIGIRTIFWQLINHTRVIPWQLVDTWMIISCLT